MGRNATTLDGQNDLVHLGDCDETVRKICADCGWLEELKDIPIQSLETWKSGLLLNIFLLPVDFFVKSIGSMYVFYGKPDSEPLNSEFATRSTSLNLSSDDINYSRAFYILKLNSFD